MSDHNELLKRIEAAEDTAARTLSAVEDMARKQDAIAEAGIARDDRHQAELIALRGVTDSHTRTLATLTDQTAKNTSIIIEHAKLHTQHAESIAASREHSRKAMESSSEIAIKHDEFQAAVMKHLSTATAGLSHDTDLLRRNDEAQNLELRAQSAELRHQSATLKDLSIASNAICSELGIAKHVSGGTGDAHQVSTIRQLIKVSKWSGLGAGAVALAFLVKTIIELFAAKH